MTSDLAIDALLMAVWRRKPKQQIMVHSEQRSQCRSCDRRKLFEGTQINRQYDSFEMTAITSSRIAFLKREEIMRKNALRGTMPVAISSIHVGMFYNSKTTPWLQ